MPRVVGRRCKFLVVDDTLSTRVLLRRLLVPHGEVILAASVAEAAAALTAHTDIDAVIVDWRLPDGDAFGFIDVHRGRLKALSVLVLTAYDDKWIPNACQMRNVSFAYKDLKRENVDAIVREVMARIEHATGLGRVRKFLLEHGLTENNCSTTIAALRHRSVQDAADELKRSRETVRTTLKHVYDVLEVRTLHQVAALILGVYGHAGHTRRGDVSRTDRPPQECDAGPARRG